MFYDKAIEKGILPGVKVGEDKLLVAVTEKRTKEDIRGTCCSSLNLNRLYAKFL